MHIIDHNSLFSELTPSRGFVIDLASAFTVLVASILGLPVLVLTNVGFLTRHLRNIGFISYFCLISTLFSINPM